MGSRMQDLSPRRVAALAALAVRAGTAPAGPARGATTDLCEGLVQDRAAHPMTEVAKPAAGQSFLDPQFGTTIRRISDAAASGATIVKPMYSTVPAWNADESYLLLYHSGGAGIGHHLYDGRTYRHLKQLDIAPADLEQVYWDATNPRILYYVHKATRTLRRFDVVTDSHASSKVVHDFSTPPTSCRGSLSGGGDPMWTSWNSRRIGLVCDGNKQFTYDLATDTVGKVVTLDAGDIAAQAAPSGELFFLNRKDVSEVRDRDLTLLRTLRGVGGNAHASLGTADGVDTFFSVQYDTPVGDGTLFASDLATGVTRPIIAKATGYPYPPSGTHVSAIAYRRPGWLALSVVGKKSAGRVADGLRRLRGLLGEKGEGAAPDDRKLGQNLLDSEILLVNANTGGTVCRVAHHRSCGRADDCGSVGYMAEPHAVISPSGTRILFGSDWGGEPRVETYVVELPAYRR